MIDDLKTSTAPQKLPHSFTGFGISTSDYIPKQMFTLDALLLLCRAAYKERRKGGVNYLSPRMVVLYVVSDIKSMLRQALNPELNLSQAINISRDRGDQFSDLLLIARDMLGAAGHVFIHSMVEIEKDPKFGKILKDCLQRFQNPGSSFFHKYCPYNQLEKVLKARGDTDVIVHYAIWEAATIICNACQNPPRKFVSHEFESDFAVLAQELVQNITCDVVYDAMCRDTECMRTLTTSADATLTDEERKRYEDNRAKFESDNRIESLDEYARIMFIRKMAVLVFDMNPMEFLFQPKRAFVEHIHRCHPHLIPMAERLKNNIAKVDLETYTGVDCRFESLGGGRDIRSRSTKPHYDITGGRNWNEHNIYLGYDSMATAKSKFAVLLESLDELVPVELDMALKEEILKCLSMSAKELNEKVSGPSPAAAAARQLVMSVREKKPRDTLTIDDIEIPESINGRADISFDELRTEIERFLPMSYRALERVFSGPSLLFLAAYRAVKDARSKIKKERGLECPIHEIPVEMKDIVISSEVVSDVKIRKIIKNRLVDLRTHAKNYLKDIVIEVILYKKRILGTLEGDFDPNDDSYIPPQGDKSRILLLNPDLTNKHRSGYIERRLLEARRDLSSDDPNVVASATLLILGVLDGNVLWPFAERLATKWRSKAELEIEEDHYDERI